jgi:hypothetical protein
VRLAIADRLELNSREAVRARLTHMSTATGQELDALVEEGFRIVTFPGTSAAFARLAETIRSEVDALPRLEHLGRIIKTTPALQIWGVEDRSIPTGTADHPFGTGIRAVGVRHPALCCGTSGEADGVDTAVRHQVFRVGVVQQHEVRHAAAR